MKPLTLLTLLTLHTTIARSAYLCDRKAAPSIYRLDEPDTCADDEGHPVTLNITTLNTTPYRVRGWVITLYEYTCITHYFFWGSYSSTHSLSPLKKHLQEVTDPRCPEEYIQFSEEKDLIYTCTWAWPKEVATSQKACKITSGYLENSAGGYYVDGIKADCKEYTCYTDSGSTFLHTTSISTLDLDSAEVIIKDNAICTSTYCTF